MIAELFGVGWVATIIITATMAAWGFLAVVVVVGALVAGFYQIGKPLQ